MPGQEMWIWKLRPASVTDLCGAPGRAVADRAEPDRTGRVARLQPNLATDGVVSGGILAAHITF